MSTTGKIEKESINTPKVPIKGKRNILITSALPYVNNVPHLGNIIGAVLSGDVYSRFCKNRGYNSIYIGGTDEYGTATETKALEEGLTCQEICDKYHKIHKEIYDWFNIDFDYFGRTTNPNQKGIVHKIILDLHKNNYLIEKEVEQLFCPELKKFLADRLVIGTCPHCGYEKCRGDQCDHCQKLLDSPLELINPKSKISNSQLIKKKTNHLFFNLPKLDGKLVEWYKEKRKNGVWTSIAESVTESWHKQGTIPRCVTRDLKWGTSVPIKGFEDKVFYVWFGAPIGYISITATYSKDWEKWWKNTDKEMNIEYTQFMGKDNIPFHSIIFPATLLGTSDNWTTVDSLSSTEYLNYENSKFSKSLGVGVFGDQCKKTGIPSDIFRFYLLSMRPENTDTFFLWDDLMARNNNELLNNFGNFVNRSLKFINSSFESKIPKIPKTEGGQFDLTEKEKQIFKSVNEKLKIYIDLMEKQKMRDSLKTILDITRIGNGYIQENKPWELVKTNKEKCGKVVAFGSQIVFLITHLIEPFMPTMSSEISKQLNISNKFTLETEFKLTFLKEGHKIGKAAPLVQKIKPDSIKKYKLMFGEKQPFAADLRIGKIINSKHQDLEKKKNYLLEVDVGEKKTRKIVAGIASHYKDPKDVIGKKVIVVCNLKPAKIEGDESEGMVLAAKSKKDMCLIIPKDQSIEIGSNVSPESLRIIKNKELTIKDLRPILKNFKISKQYEVNFKSFKVLTKSKTVESIIIVEEKIPFKGIRIC